MMGIIMQPPISLAVMLTERPLRPNGIRQGSKAPAAPDVVVRVPPHIAQHCGGMKHFPEPCPS